MKRFLILLGSLLLAFSCRQGEVEVAVAPKLTLSEEMAVFSRTGGVALVDVDANNDWSAEVSSGADWIDMEVSGQGITISADANPLYELRMGAVTVRSGKLFRVVSITQMSVPNNDRISITPLIFTFQAEGGSQFIDVDANVEMAITPSEEWLSVSEEGGKYYVVAQANQSTDARLGSISFTGGHAKEVVVTVSQNGKSPLDPLKGLVAEWRCDDPAYVDSHSPDWSTSGANDYSKGSGLGKALPEDGAPEGTYMTWNFAGNHSFPIIYITAAEGHFAVKSCAKGDGFLFTVPKSDLLAGQKVTMDCAVAGVAQTCKNWVVKFRTSPDDEWEVGQSATAFTTSSGETAFMAISKAKDFSAAARFQGTYTVKRDLDNVDLQILVCAADAQTISKAITSGATARLLPLVGSSGAVEYPGARITVE